MHEEFIKIPRDTLQNYMERIQQVLSEDYRQGIIKSHGLNERNRSDVYPFLIGEIGGLLKDLKNEIHQSQEMMEDEILVPISKNHAEYYCQFCNKATFGLLEKLVNEENDEDAFKMIKSVHVIGEKINEIITDETEVEPYK